MNNFKMYINGQSAKCTEIASELSAFGVYAVVRPDLSQEIPDGVGAVVIDKSNEEFLTKPSLDANSDIKIFILTNPTNDQISSENGVIYMPVTLETQSMVTIIRSIIGASVNVRKTTARFLMSIGVPAHLKGYRYLIEAIIMNIKNPDGSLSFTQEIYPQIAKKFNTTYNAVDRAMRNAIEKTYEGHESGYFKKIFGYSVQNPSNSEFISWCAEKIRLEYL